MTIRLDSFGQLRHGFTKQVDNTAAVVLTILFPVHVLITCRSFVRDFTPPRSQNSVPKCEGPLENFHIQSNLPVSIISRRSQISN